MLGYSVHFGWSIEKNDLEPKNFTRQNGNSTTVTKTLWKCWTILFSLQKIIFLIFHHFLFSDQFSGSCRQTRLSDNLPIPIKRGQQNLTQKTRGHPRLARSFEGKIFREIKICNCQRVWGIWCKNLITFLIRHQKTIVMITYL